MRTRITRNTDTFHAVNFAHLNIISLMEDIPSNLLVTEEKSHVGFYIELNLCNEVVNKLLV